MYICQSCGALFDEPRRISERHGLDYGPYEEWYCCPICGGDFAETTTCCDCGEYIRGEFVVVNGCECYCDNCYELHDIRDT